MKTVMTKDANGNNLRFNISDHIVSQVSHAITALKEVADKERFNENMEEFILTLLDICEVTGEEVREDRQVFSVTDDSCQHVDKVFLDGDGVDNVFLAYTGEQGMVGHYVKNFIPAYKFGKVEVTMIEGN